MRQVGSLRVLRPLAAGGAGRHAFRLAGTGPALAPRIAERNTRQGRAEQRFLLGAGAVLTPFWCSAAGLAVVALGVMVGGLVYARRRRTDRHECRIVIVDDGFDAAA